MYGSSHKQQSSKDLNQPYPPPPAPAPAPEDVSGGRRDGQETDIFRRHQQQQQQQLQMSSGLLRYRSAPSSLFGDDFLPVRPSSPETDADAMFARLFPTDLDKASASEAGGPSAEMGLQFDGGPHIVFHSEQGVEMKNSACNLIRQSSSPAGLFSHLNVDNGFGMMRGTGGFRNANSPSGDSANRLKGQLSFLSRQNSIMSQISEIGSEDMDGGSPEDTGSQSFIPGFPIGSWDEPSILSENNFPVLKRSREGEVKILSGVNSSQPQNGEVRNHVSVLPHQFSLPKTSSEMAAIEKFLQLQDAVPCKIRAKRGCATHPRSIAERVRRTKISERMRKLQELVPNMDKQTNTADMLDLAVDYIKELQKQVKALSNESASCACSSSKQKSHPNSSA